MNANIIRGNGPKPPTSFEDEIGELARSVDRAHPPTTTSEHPALIACRKAAEMVRGVHERHAAEGETLALHLEQIGETFMQMCKEAAGQIRQQRILPKEMSDKIADDVLRIGEMEAERQAVVSRGLKAASEAILGIDKKDEITRSNTM
jgi:hypothetical protein